MRKWPHPRSLKAINLSLKKNGSVIGCNYAEAFVGAKLLHEKLTLKKCKKEVGLGTANFEKNME